MSIQLTNISFLKKISLVLSRKAFVIYTDNPIPSLLIPLPETAQTVKSQIYKIFSDLSSNQILRFHNKNLSQKDLNNIERESLAKLTIQEKNIPQNINLENVENIQIKNDSIFLTANLESGKLEFKPLEKIKEAVGEYFNKEKSTQSIESQKSGDGSMNNDKQGKLRNQAKQHTKDNVQKSSKQTGKSDQKSSTKQEQLDKKDDNKPGQGIGKKQGKSDKIQSQVSNKPSQPQPQLQPTVGRRLSPEAKALGNIFDLDNPPRTVPNEISKNPGAQPYLQLNKSQPNPKQSLGGLDIPKTDKENHYFKGLEQQKQRIIPLGLLTDHIANSPINIIHIQTSRQYLFLQGLKLFCLLNMFSLYGLIHLGTRSENHDQITK